MADNAADILERLLATPFPSSPAPPRDEYAWDFYQEFLANAPRRLVEIIATEYQDPQQAEPGEEPNAIEIELSYRERFAEAVRGAEARFGLALKPGSDGAPWTRFNEEFFNFDRHDLARWPVNGRLAILHFAIQFGDDDFQVSLTACVAPDDRAA